MNDFWELMSGIFTALLIPVFAGLVWWAWSSRRKPAFDAAARLPLEEDVGGGSGTGSVEDRT